MGRAVLARVANTEAGVKAAASTAATWGAVSREAESERAAVRGAGYVWSVGCTIGPAGIDVANAKATGLMGRPAPYIAGRRTVGVPAGVEGEVGAAAMHGERRWLRKLRHRRWHSANCRGNTSTRRSSSARRLLNAGDSNRKMPAWRGSWPSPRARPWAMGLAPRRMTTRTMTWTLARRVMQRGRKTKGRREWRSTVQACHILRPRTVKVQRKSRTLAKRLKKFSEPPATPSPTRPIAGSLSVARSAWANSKSAMNKRLTTCSTRSKNCKPGSIKSGGDGRAGQSD
jgi:hypothetical protein